MPVPVPCHRSFFPRLGSAARRDSPWNRVAKGVKEFPDFRPNNFVLALEMRRLLNVLLVLGGTKGRASSLSCAVPGSFSSRSATQGSLTHYENEEGSKTSRQSWQESAL